MRAASLVVLVLSGCAGTVAAPAVSTPANNGPESLQYDVSLRGVQVGHVVVAIGEPGEVDGNPVVIMRSRATGGGVVSLFSDLTWDLESVVSPEDGHALSEEEQVDICPLMGAPVHEHNKRDLAGASEYNVHGAAEMLRAWHSRCGEAKTFSVRISDIDLDVSLHDASREVVAKMPAVRYDGIVRDTYPVSIWISDDAARVPLRMVGASKWGEMAVDLVAYDATSR